MFTPKFNIGALVLIATTPPVQGTVTGYYQSVAGEEPYYSVQRSDSLEDMWYRESKLSLPQPTAALPPKYVHGQAVILGDGSEARVESCEYVRGRYWYNLSSPGMHHRYEERALFGSPDEYRKVKNKPSYVNELSAAMARLNKPKESAVEKAAREYREAVTKRNDLQARTNKCGDELTTLNAELKAADSLCKDRHKAFMAAADLPQPVDDKNFTRGL